MVLKKVTQHAYVPNVVPVPSTAAQLAETKQQDEARRAELTKKGKPLPEAIAWDKVAPRAYIRGDYYEWSPYDGPILEVRKTTEATEATEATDSTTARQQVAHGIISMGNGPI